MIVMRHHPSSRGWEFNSSKGDLCGGGRDLEESIDTAEHVARRHFTTIQGYEVLHADARARIRHAVECVERTAAA